ncbi:head maturation protease, ClpP-related [Prescottella equi]|uniref:head maturation protease, ClpP-related n=1 Tax=Rhodococcus hoagii TaxID=43767 RepID=UPI0007CD89A9|nr:head maturation protease, ClpP-related [Prescottella equi]ORL01557.1 hypothetical protein A6F56_04355 [Prescottella equi]
MNRNRRRPRASAQQGRRDWYRIVNSADTETGAAEVMIYDEIGYWGVTAADFASDLKAIDSGTLTVHLNSPGGEVYDGIAILNALRNHKATVTVIVDGIAASAASFIAMAGDEIIMCRNAELMIHDSWGWCSGNAEEMTKAAAELDRVSDNIASIYAERAGGTAEEWRALMREETWYSAQEAVDAGLADRVAAKEAPDDGEDDTEASNRFDLSVFNYAGRRSAPAPRIPRRSNRADTRPGSQPRASDNPADESAAGTTTEGTATVEFTDEQLAALREALDLEDDATADDIVTAVEELATTPDPEEADPAESDDTAVVDRTSLARLQADAALGREAHARLARQDRERIVDSAIVTGRIAPAKRDTWISRLEADPTEASTLAKLEPVYPVGEPIGHDANPQAAGEDALYNKLFPTKEA